MREMRYNDIITTLAWHEVKKVARYYLSVDALQQPMTVKDKSFPYGEKESL